MHTLYGGWALRQLCCAPSQYYLSQPCPQYTTSPHHCLMITQYHLTPSIPHITTLPHHSLMVPPHPINLSHYHLTHHYLTLPPHHITQYHLPSQYYITTLVPHSITSSITSSQYYHTHHVFTVNTSPLTPSLPHSTGPTALAPSKSHALNGILPPLATLVLGIIRKCFHRDKIPIASFMES